ncbi:HutD family protein [Luteimonas sp. Y-2-2-4F]|nr:HutD family protein [Luteimonas sp. Y-2-2-4F]MCD9030722.1 HutD family protein [Luteimonas sp. Y-2-2-4F]
MAAASRVIPANEYTRVRWRNGAGWTREIGAWPVPEDWHWRLSIAEIERAAPYSPYPGVMRQQWLLHGEGLALAFPDGERARLVPPHGSVRFEGGRAPAAEPDDGRATVFNLMWRPEAAEVEARHRPLVGAMVCFPAPGETWALHLLAGRAAFAADAGLPPLEAGDTALLSSQVRRRFLLEGQGELLAIAVRDRA